MLTGIGRKSVRLTGSRYAVSCVVFEDASGEYWVRIDGRMIRVRHEYDGWREAA